jgi:hypothetical protein
VRAPVGEVGGQRPQGDRRVDGGAAAQDLAAGRADLTVERACPACRRVETPVVLLVATDPFRVEQDVWVLVGLVCRPGFQQQHGPGRILRQPRR